MDSCSKELWLLQIPSRNIVDVHRTFKNAKLKPIRSANEWELQGDEGERLQVLVEDDCLLNGQTFCVSFSEETGQAFSALPITRTLTCFPYLEESEGEGAREEAKEGEIEEVREKGRKKVKSSVTEIAKLRERKTPRAGGNETPEKKRKHREERVGEKLLLKDSQTKELSAGEESVKKKKVVKKEGQKEEREGKSEGNSAGGQVKELKGDKEDVKKEKKKKKKKRKEEAEVEGNVSACLSAGKEGELSVVKSEEASLSSLRPPPLTSFSSALGTPIKQHNETTSVEEGSKKKRKKAK